MNVGCAGPFSGPAKESSMSSGRVVGRLLAKVAFGALLLGSETGCSGFSPRVALLVARETPPMTVVVRRADAARATAANVERLLSATGVDADSKWVGKIALKKADIDTMLQDVGGDPEYDLTKGGKLRVVQAEAWARTLSTICSTESKQPSLYATISADVQSGYADIAAQAKMVGKIKSDIAAEEAAADDKDRAGEKAEHEAKKKDLTAQLDKTEADYKPKVEAFLNKLKEETAKASPEAKKQLAPVLAGLRRAVDDARFANTVAALGYVRAVPGLKDEVKSIVKIIAADAIEEQLGKRPNLAKLAPEVKLTGGVSVTIAGLAPEDIGKLKPEDLVKGIAERAKNYVVHVVTLLPYTKETGELLDLQASVIDTAMKGIAADEKGGGEDLSDLQVEVSVTGGKKRMKVPMDSCAEGKPAAKAEAPAPPPAPVKEEVAVAPVAEEKDSKKAKGGKADKKGK
jgi:hypothetical protein